LGSDFPNDRSPFSAKEIRSFYNLRVAVSLNRFEIVIVIGYDGRPPSTRADCDENIKRHALGHAGWQPS